jgi:hypothetical protein
MCGKDLVKLDQHVTESRPTFIQRVEFLIRALDQGHSVEYSQTLSYAYQNKLQSLTRYLLPIEEEIQKIVDIMAGTTQIHLPHQVEEAGACAQGDTVG